MAPAQHVPRSPSGPQSWARFSVLHHMLLLPFQALLSPRSPSPASSSALHTLFSKALFPLNMW